MEEALDRAYDKSEKGTATADDAKKKDTQEARFVELITRRRKQLYPLLSKAVEEARMKKTPQTRKRSNLCWQYAAAT